MSLLSKSIDKVRKWVKKKILKDDVLNRIFNEAIDELRNIIIETLLEEFEKWIEDKK